MPSKYHRATCVVERLLIRTGTKPRKLQENGHRPWVCTMLFFASSSSSDENNTVLESTSNIRYGTKPSLSLLPTLAAGGVHIPLLKGMGLR